MQAALSAVLSGFLMLSALPASGDTNGSAKEGALPAASGACMDNNDCLLAAYRKAIDAAKRGRYMEASFGLLADVGVDAPEQIRDEDVFDQWSQVWSAMAGEPSPNGSKPAYRHFSGDEIALLEAAQARPAIAEIVARAKKTRIVILDEDHLAPRDRAFGLEVASALRPLGYSLLAVETLTRDQDDLVSHDKMAALAKDGYVRRASGYYINDPVFADYLRQALGMGYGLISYESAGFDKEQSAEARLSRREQEQAENLVRRSLAKDPSVKVLIYCGRHHAAKTEISGESEKGRLFMAARLKQLTGIDPLVIDQVELGERPTDRPDAELYAVASKKAQGQSVVLMEGRRPVIVGLLAGAVDLQVVHPRVPPAYGRPGWLAAMGRRPADIPASLLPDHGARLIQAFLDNEAQDAIPIDQVLVRAGQPVPKLMLPRDAVIRYTYQDDPRISSEARAAALPSSASKNEGG